MLMAINWNVSPEIFPDTVIPVRWYGLLFASAFLIGFELLKRMFKSEGHPVEWTDKALIYTMVGCLVGARLGHVFFYDWQYYLQRPTEIIMFWKGGLASHGAAIGIILAMYFFSKKITHKSMFWILDRVVIPVAQGGVLIRIGNLMNSEIYGKPTGSDWGFVFMRSDEFLMPRYPTQLMEAACYLVVFVFLWYSFFKTDMKQFVGRLFGWFLVLVFGVRFFMEFLKENQVDFEGDLPLNMGQILSIPAVLAGIYFIVKAKKEVSA